MLWAHSYVCGKINLRLEVREEGFCSLWIRYSMLNIKVATDSNYPSLQDFIVGCRSQVTLDFQQSNIISNQQRIKHTLYTHLAIHTVRGRDSSVGIATRYGLDGPGIVSPVAG